jgi:hypothetical protein
MVADLARGSADDALREAMAIEAKTLAQRAARYGNAGPTNAKTYSGRDGGQG